MYFILFRVKWTICLIIAFLLKMMSLYCILYNDMQHTFSHSIQLWLKLETDTFTAIVIMVWITVTSNNTVLIYYVMVNVLTINNNNSHKITAAIICFPNCFVFMVFFFFLRGRMMKPKTKMTLLQLIKSQNPFHYFIIFWGLC